MSEEAQRLLDELRKAEVPVIVHPTMARASGERRNLAMDTAARLQSAGIPVALQSGYESYVPKTRVVLFEAGIAWAYGREHGMSHADAPICRSGGTKDSSSANPPVSVRMTSAMGMWTCSSSRSPPRA